MTIKEVKKALKLEDKDFAEMFGYKNVDAYRNSSAKKRIEQGIANFYARFHLGQDPLQSKK